jgi:hypothetical protein
MDILSRQRRSKVGISPQFKFAVQFRETYYQAGVSSSAISTVEVLARTKKKALTYFRKHFTGEDVEVVKIFSPKERKRHAPQLQKTFATNEAKRITDEIFGSNNESSAQSVQ